MQFFVELSSHCRVGGLVDSLTLRGGGKSVELCCCGGGQLVELKNFISIFCSHVLTSGEPPFSCHTTLRRLLWFTSRPDLSSWISVMPWWVGMSNDPLGWVGCRVVSSGWLIGSWLTPKFWVDWNLILTQSSTFHVVKVLSDACSYRIDRVRAIAAFPIMLWWSTVTSAMETVHSPQVLCRREGAAQPAILLKFWVWFFKLINSNLLQ